MAQKQNSEEDMFPEGFFCPLTLQIMTDPVMDPEGNTYERTAIENWLQKNETSPVTRNPLKIGDLVPNRALRNAIEEKRKQLGDKDLSHIVFTKKSSANDSTANENRNENKNQQNQPKPKDSVRVDVCATRSLSIGEDAFVMASIRPPLGDQPTPCDICCVVDVSGSMSTEAVLQNAQGNKESHGLSLLDVVKHAVKTVINILHPHDRLAVVSYHSDAKVELELTKMDDAGKKKAIKVVEGLYTQGQTNLWDGLHKGLEVLRKGEKKGNLSSVLLLTDGQPNVVPPRGHIPMLKKYKDENRNMATINTFGFGYNLQSDLLRDLAQEGNGIYAFIPDSGFVGTAFVHATSNLLATMATNVQVSFEAHNGASILEGAVLGYPTTYSSWGATVALGTLQYEQVKNVVVTMKLPSLPEAKPYVTVTVKYQTKNNDTLEVQEDGIGFDDSQKGEVEVQRFRLLAVDRIQEAMKLHSKGSKNEAVNLIKGLIEGIKALKNKDKRLEGLLEDLAGEVTRAFTKDEWYSKWGIHYLPSLSNAHLLQMCNNFKDPGVQFYGGNVFNKERDLADEIFLKLPAPKPSANPHAAPISNMHSYHSRGNPCFHGDCIVEMAEGEKKVKDVQKGDKVMTPSGNLAEVVCVVKTPCLKGTTNLVELPQGLLVTPYHPVMVKDAWQFPCDLGEVKNRPCEAVYSFVLQEEHVMIINGTKCVTLGHNFQEEVVKHPYFGSRRVIEDLEKMQGWEAGLVQLKEECLRDSQTSLVCGLVPY